MTFTRITVPSAFTWGVSTPTPLFLPTLLTATSTILRTKVSEGRFEGEEVRAGGGLNGSTSSNDVELRSIFGEL